MSVYIVLTHGILIKKWWKVVLFGPQFMKSVNILSVLCDINWSQNYACFLLRIEWSMMVIYSCIFLNYIFSVYIVPFVGNVLAIKETKNRYMRQILYDYLCDIQHSGFYFLKPQFYLEGEVIEVKDIPGLFQFWQSVIKISKAEESVTFLKFKCLHVAWMSHSWYSTFTTS